MSGPRAATRSRNTSTAALVAGPADGPPALRPAHDPAGQARGQRCGGSRRGATTGVAVAGTIAAPNPSKASEVEQAHAVDLGQRVRGVMPAAVAAASIICRSTADPGGQQQGLTRQRPQRHDVAVGEGVIGGHDQHQVLVEQRLDAAGRGRRRAGCTIAPSSWPADQLGDQGRWWCPRPRSAWTSGWLRAAAAAGPGAPASGRWCRSRRCGRRRPPRRRGTARSAAMASSSCWIRRARSTHDLALVGEACRWSGRPA